MSEHYGQSYVREARVDKRSSDEEMAAAVEKVWEEFWQPIMEREVGGPVQFRSALAQFVKSELFDYHTLMSGASQVYDAVSGGRISKPLTDPHHVISAAEEHFRRYALLDVMEVLQFERDEAAGELGELTFTDAIDAIRENFSNELSDDR